MTEEMNKYIAEIVGVDTGHSTLNEAIFNYLVYGIPPGGFTTSLLENNLYEAICRADHWNKENIVYVVKEVGMNMPLLAWGSPERVRLWLKDEDNRRTEYSEQVLEQATMMKLES